MNNCPPLGSIVATAMLLALSIAQPPHARAQKCLPGELTADQVLDGDYPYPPSPKVESHDDWTGFANERLGKVPPPPGVHPRILISPDDLPDLRRRLKETEVGKALYATLQNRPHSAIRNPADWSSQLYDRARRRRCPRRDIPDGQHDGFPATLATINPGFTPSSSKHSTP